MNLPVRALAAASMLAVLQAAQATDLLVVTPQEQVLGYGYGGSHWGGFTHFIDAAVAASGGRITTATELTASALRFDALMVDFRWTGLLSEAELRHLETFAATGKRLLFVGENTVWQEWNGQFLDLVGGRFIDRDVFARAHRVLTDPLTRNVPFIELFAAGTVVGGTALFDQNFATLWGQQRSLLSVLDVNVFDDSNGNRAFERNVATWLASPIPEPGTLAMMLVGLGVLGFAARCRCRS